MKILVRAMATCTFAALALHACTPSDQGVPDGDSEVVGSDETTGTDTSGAVQPADAFWASLSELCGQAFEGRVEESIPPDPGFDGETLVMHVRECGDDEMRIPFHVGDDRSRTWVLTRTDDGLRLKHDHRHEDGSPDEITDYGGDTPDAGTATRQDFHADDHTAELVPAAATNIWTVGVDRDAGTFTYALRREGTDRRFRAVFDLTQPVDPPPPPWGS